MPEVTYEQYVTETFKDHHDCMGLGSDEIDDLVEETTHEQRERWLKRQGYDLDGMWEVDKSC